MRTLRLQARDKKLLFLPLVTYDMKTNIMALATSGKCYGSNECREDLHNNRTRRYKSTFSKQEMVKKAKQLLNMIVDGRARRYTAATGRYINASAQPLVMWKLGLATMPTSTAPSSVNSSPSSISSKNSDASEISRGQTTSSSVRMISSPLKNKRAPMSFGPNNNNLGGKGAAVSNFKIPAKCVSSTTRREEDGVFSTLERANSRTVDSTSEERRVPKQVQSKEQGDIGEGIDDDIPKEFRSLDELESENPSILFGNKRDEDELLYYFGMCNWVWQEKHLMRPRNNSNNNGTKEKGISKLTHNTIDNTRITTIFKQRFQDFRVTELTAEGSVVPGGHRCGDSATGGNRIIDRDFSIPPIPDGLKAVLGLKTSVTNTDNQIGPNSAIFNPVDISEQLSSAMSLDEIKGVLPMDSDGNLIPNTESKLGDCINSRGAGKRGAEIGPRRGRVHFYVHCTLHKRRVAHSDALYIIGSELGINVNRISVAGIKDFNGETIQRISFEGVSPMEIKEANKRIGKYRKDITLSNYKYSTEPLIPGRSLYGNRFQIILRDVALEVKPKDDSVPGVGSSSSHNMIDHSLIKRSLEEAVNRVAKQGVPNYYGSQRFSGFAGDKDSVLAGPIHKNWLMFAFRHLNFTTKPRTLRQLLQRPNVYPTHRQGRYRRLVIKKMKSVLIHPTYLDEKHQVFAAPPKSYTDFPAENVSSNKPVTQATLIVQALEEAFDEMDDFSRRMMCQAFASYLWNQSLSARVHHFGLSVCEGDIVSLKRFMNNESSLQKPDNNNNSGKKSDNGTIQLDVANSKDSQSTDGVFKIRRTRFRRNESETNEILLEGIVDEKNKSFFEVDDVLLPFFTFEDQKLPENVTSDIYHSICDKYYIRWEGKYRKEFSGGKRNMVVRPTNLSIRYYESGIHFRDEVRKSLALERDDKTTPLKDAHHHNPDINDTSDEAADTSTNMDNEEPLQKGPVAVISFDLPKGSYANVVLTEILRHSRCLGSEQVKTLPRPEAEWDFGKKDPHCIETMEGVYEELQKIEDDAMRLEDETPDMSYDEVYKYKGNFLKEDIHKSIKKWSERSLIGNLRKRLEMEDITRKQLFEEPLRRMIQDGEINNYAAGHGIPLAPNSTKRVQDKINRRNKRKMPLVSHVKRGAQVQRPWSKRRPETFELSHDAWNIR